MGLAPEPYQDQFAKGKVKRVKKLETHNQELQDILGYSDRVVPAADARKTFHPVSVLEEIRQYACTVYDLLRRQWICNDRNCCIHKAHLRVNAQEELLMQTVKQEMEVRPFRGGNDTFGGVETAVSDVRSATSFRVRDPFQTSRSLETTSRSSRLFSQASQFPIIPPRIVVSQHNSPESPPSANRCINNPPSPRISDLCSILRSDDKKTLRIIFEKADRRFKFSRLLESDLTTKAPSTAKLVPLPEILSAHHQTTMKLAMATAICPGIPHNLCTASDEHVALANHPMVEA